MTEPGDRNNAKILQAPPALLLMGEHCPYCPTMLRELQTLATAGIISKLETVAIEKHPEIARELGVRTVPWVRIGPFELEGLRSATELRKWAGKAGTETGIVDWMNELLASGKLAQVEKWVKRVPDNLGRLLEIFAQARTPLNIRIGISAIVEGLEGNGLLETQMDRLAELTRNAESGIRGDACHFLALTGSPDAVPLIESMLNDPSSDVGGVARDSLEHLRKKIPG